MSEEKQVQVVEATALQMITEGEISQQVATAHKYPRSLALFNQRASDMICQDEDVAASCIYSRPIGKDTNGKEKFAEGKSIRMAEIVGASYGNLRVGAMLIEQTQRQIKARGFAHDLESNFAVTSEVVESTVYKDGTPYKESMRVVIAKAALAKARRDATFQVVPGALCKNLEDLARTIALGDATTLDKRRTKLMEWIGKLGIPVIRVFNALSVKGLEDIGIKELELLTGLKTAIKDGDIPVDEAFPAESSKPTDVPMPTPKPKEKAAKTAQDAPKTEAPPTMQKTENGQIEPVKPMVEADYLREFGIIAGKLYKQTFSEADIKSLLIKNGFSPDYQKAKDAERAGILKMLGAFVEPEKK